MRKKLLVPLLVIAFVFGSIVSGHANSTYFGNVGMTYPAAMGTQIYSCTLCHAASGPPNLNPYGNDFAAAGHNFQTIESKDSDGDGFNNITEINAGTFPGDATSHPAPATPPPAPTPAPIPTPIPTPMGMQMPSGKFMFPYPAVSSPVMSSDPAQAMPIGVGPVAQGGNSLTLQVNLGQFLSPMDVYAGWGISTDPDKLYFLNSNYSIQTFTFSEVIQALSSGTLPAGVGPWKSAVMEPVNETLVNGLPVSQLGPGTYTLFLLTTPAGSPANFYIWRTSFDVAGMDGTALYAQNCSGCHGNIATSTKLGRSSSAIQSAITSNAGGSMGSLNYLATAQIDAIADALIAVIPPVPMPSVRKSYSYPATDFPVVDPDPSKTRPIGVGPVSLGGDTVDLQFSLGRFISPVDIYFALGVPTDANNLYIIKKDSTIQVYPKQNLLAAAFFGALPSAVMSGGIQPWKTGVEGPIDEHLFSAPISQIAPGVYSLYVMVTVANDPSTYYAWETQFGGSYAPDGATLYGQNCAGCHGPLATSTKIGRTATQIQTAINTMSAMSGLSSLTSAQVQAIAGVLAAQTPPPPPPVPTTTDGPTLYGQYCASCHGALASSAKAGRTAAQISAAINTVGAMSGLPSLTTAQVEAIATALGQQTPPPPTTTDGPTLYGQYCASCHGALASSTKAGRTATQISAAIANPSYPMGSLSSLTSAQVQAIATALASQSPSPTPVPSGHPSNWRSTHGDYVEKNGTVSCTSCHGADLRGGSGPSCYSCHGKRW